MTTALRPTVATARTERGDVPTDRYMMMLRARLELSSSEESAIRDAIAEVQTISARTTFRRAGELYNHCALLLDGLAYHYRDLATGARQITQIHVPGDFVDLESFVCQTFDHDSRTVTACRVAIVPHDRLALLIEEHPNLTRAFWLSTNLNAAMHCEWMVTLGRRRAAAGLAALFCEMQVRLALVGLAGASEYMLPLAQGELGDCLGLTTVHVNRALRDLRERGLVTFRENRVEIHDMPALRKLADFDESYLLLPKTPR